MTTLETSSLNTNQTTQWDKEKDLKEEFSYLLEMAKSINRSTENMKNCLVRIGTKMADKYFSYGMPEMCKTIPTVFTSFLHKHGVYEFNQVVYDTFRSTAWLDVIQDLKTRYRTPVIDDKNLLVTVNKDKTSQQLAEDLDIDTLSRVLERKLQDPNLDGQTRQIMDSKIQKMFVSNRETCTTQKTTLPEPDNETLQLKDQSVQKKAAQLRTPVYSIEEIHKMRQDIVCEGLDACIQQFKIMREKVIYEIPIQTDEEAYAWRDGFIDLANNFTALGDDKHRVDFGTWAKTFENIEKYGAEKGLKMSGQEITEHDLSLIDKNTLPIHYYENYKKIGLSYISKEHLDSKGVLIANCFVDMMNRMAWLSTAAQAFSYFAKLRGIRALAVSNKLSNSK